MPLFGPAGPAVVSLLAAIWVQTSGTSEERATARSPERVRNLRGLPTDVTYQLVVWDRSRVTLSDLETDRHTSKISFGPTNTDALAELLSLRIEAA